MNFQSLPPLSVLIRTFNSARTLPVLLRRLDPGSDDEILIVDSGSSDNTLAIAESFPQTRIIRVEPPFHYSLSLNAGFEIARNPWVISVSSHCIPLSPHFLDQWRDFLAALPGDVAAAFGTRHFSEAEAQPELPVVIYDRKSPANTFNIFAGSSNGAYRRECWLLHPFETSISTGEDVEWGRWALATGRRTAWIPGVPVLYRHQGSFAYMFRKGWAESMVFADPQTKHSVLRLFLLNFASITKKLFLGKIPSGVWRRQMGHTMGVSAATAVLRWRALKSSK